MIFSWLDKHVPTDWDDMVAMPFFLGMVVGIFGAVVMVAVVMGLALSGIRGPGWFEMSMFGVVGAWISYWFTAGMYCINYWYDNIDPRRRK